jgi:nicotinamide-nucleotide amidase
MTPRFDLVSQGEEIVSGKTTDTNAGWIAGELGGIGMMPGRFTTVGDLLEDIRDALGDAAARSPLVVCTGGLGPTSDDLTAQAAALAFTRPLEERADALAQVEARYRARNRPMPPKNRKQALMPAGAEVLENHLGTAPGFSLDVGRSILFFFPGVPFEMKPMVADYVLPAARARFALSERRTIILRCCGLAESIAAERMDGFERPGVVVGYRASFPEVQVKLHLDAGQDAEALVADTRARLGDHVFAVDGPPLPEVVGQLLVGRGETVALAESCTGGRISAELCAVPGASRYVLGGAVVYSNAEKTRQCGVSEALLAEHGAVSEAVARGLAEGVRARAGSTWGLGVTGIAGPTGGSPEKPVGTVHFAVAGPAGTTWRMLRLPYDRARNLSATAFFALDLLRRALLN